MGKGGGGGSAHTPYEAPNTLTSAQHLKVVDIISEGPIKTDVSLKNILLDGTPIQNKDGSYNFKGVKVSYLAGQHTQGTLKDFEQVSKVINVGAEVKENKPIVRTITDPLVDSVRIIITLGSLLKVQNNGDRLGGAVDLEVEVGDRYYPLHIEGKTTSSYNQDLLIEHLPDVPFNISVRRITPDSKTQNVSNKTYWNVYVENTDTKFTYPDTVVVGLDIDSAQFGGKVPVRTYLTDWQMVQVPSNYDPETRLYDGIWDGTFKYDWSDNPAWVMYDIITNKRYGLGERVNAQACDKWALYEIAKYCDQIVPDGFGSQEPRFTCNVCIEDQKEAKKLLDDIASCFRGIPIWNGNQLTFAIDCAKDPVALFNNANVVDGNFEYSSSALKTIYTAAHVQYLDKENGYKKTTEYVADDEAIARYGLNVKQFTAFGCTSRGQAARAGKWMIETSIRERQTVSFKTGMQGFCLLPWDIIQVADSDYAGEQIHGRIESINNNVVTIDRELKANSQGATFHYLTSEQGMKYCTITKIQGKTLTLDKAPAGAQEFSVFSVAKTQVAPRLFRVVGIKEDDGVFAITAITHDPHKEAVVDQGMTFNYNPKATTHQPNLFDASTTQDGDSLVVAWQGMNAVKYFIKLYRNDELYKSYTQESPEIRFKHLPNGHYRSEIVAQSAEGALSAPIVREWDIDYTINGLIATPELFAIKLDWTNPSLVLDKAFVEIWHSLSNDRDHATLVATLPLPIHSFTQYGIKLNEDNHFWLRVKDNQQNAGDFAYISGQCSHDTSAILESIHGQITKTDLAKSLIDSLQKDIDDAVAAIELPDIDLSEVDAKIEQERQQRIQADLTEVQAREQLASSFNQQRADIDNLRNTVTDNKQAATQQLNQAVANFNHTTEAKFTELKQNIATKEQATAQQMTALTAKVEEDIEAKINSNYTIKTEAIAGNRKAIAGIALGSSIDGDTVESEVIVMANKFGVVKNVGDSEIKHIFSISENKVAIDGDLIARGSINADKLHVTRLSALSSSLGNITAGTLNLGNGKFKVDSMGRVTISANPDRNIGLKITENKIIVYDEMGKQRVVLGKISE